MNFNDVKVNCINKIPFQGVVGVEEDESKVEGITNALVQRLLAEVLEEPEIQEGLKASGLLGRETCPIAFSQEGLLEGIVDKFLESKGVTNANEVRDEFLKDLQRFCTYRCTKGVKTINLPHEKILIDREGLQVLFESVFNSYAGADLGGFSHLKKPGEDLKKVEVDGLDTSSSSALEKNDWDKIDEVLDEALRESDERKASDLTDNLNPSLKPHQKFVLAGGLLAIMSGLFYQYASSLKPQVSVVETKKAHPFLRMCTSDLNGQDMSPLPGLFEFCNAVLYGKQNSGSELNVERVVGVSLLTTVLVIGILVHLNRKK